MLTLKLSRNKAKKKSDKFVWSDGDIQFGKPLSKEELARLKKPKPKEKPKGK